MNAQFAGTGRLPGNNVLAAMGSNFPTAFRAFKKTFKERTKAEWDDRIENALQRAAREKRDRGLGTGSEAGSRPGVPVSERAASVQVVEDFATMPFEYHPPRYGPQGKLPKEKFVEGGPLHNVPINGARNERVKDWMRGANGTGLEDASAPVSEHPEIPDFVRNQQAPERNHFDELMNGDTGTDINGIPIGGLPDSTIHGSIYDKDIMADLVEDTIPFPSQFDNLDFSNLDFNAMGGFDENPIQFQDEGLGNDQDTTMLEQTSGDHTEANGTQQSALPHENENHETQRDSLTPTNTNMAQNSTSFDPSTVPESFQPGTQEIGETQIAERARGEFEERIAIPAEPGPVAESTPVDVEYALPQGLNLGSSMLGKRKGSNFDDDSTWVEIHPKKQKASGETEAAPEVQERVDNGNSYLLDTETGHAAADDIPRAFLDEMQEAAGEQLQQETEMANDEGGVAV